MERKKWKLIELVTERWWRVERMGGWERGSKDEEK